MHRRKVLLIGCFSTALPRISPAQQNVTEPAIYEKRELIVRFTFLLSILYLLLSVINYIQISFCSLFSAFVTF